MDSQPHATFTTAEAGCPCLKYRSTPTALRAEAPCLMSVVEGNFVEGYSEEVINPLIETSVYSIFEVMFEVQAGFEDLLWRRLPPDP
jgi:hypothetical protein